MKLERVKLVMCPLCWYQKKVAFERDEWKCPFCKNTYDTKGITRRVFEELRDE